MGEGLGTEELELAAVGFDEVSCLIQYVGGIVLRVFIEGGVVPLVEEAFLRRIAEAELVGANDGEGGQDDLEGMTGDVAGAGHEVELLFLLGAEGAGGHGEFGEKREMLVFPVATVGDGALGVVGILLEEFDGLLVLNGLVTFGDDGDGFSGVVSDQGVMLGEQVELPGGWIALE